MATKTNLVIDQGSTFSVTISVLDADGAVVDLTNYTGAAQMRKHYTSNTSTAFAVTLGGANGTVALAMNAATTTNVTSGRYVYDVEITNTVTPSITRIIEGIVTVTPNVTR
jgi:hypothetical protein